MKHCINHYSPLFSIEFRDVPSAIRIITHHSTTMPTINHDSTISRLTIVNLPDQYHSHQNIDHQHYSNVNAQECTCILFTYPRYSMCGIFTYDMYLYNGPNVSKFTITMEYLGILNPFQATNKHDIRNQIHQYIYTLIIVVT